MNINEDENNIINFHLEALYVRCGNHIFKQISGLPMGGKTKSFISDIVWH